MFNLTNNTNKYFHYNEVMENYRKYFKDIFILSAPIILGNIAQIMLGAGDVLVASRHSTETLAAISIANAIMTSLFIVGIGLMSGITPVISNYLGAAKPSKRYFLSTINYALILSLIILIITIFGLPLLDLIGFDEKLLPSIKEYIFIVAFSNFGGYVFFALKEFLQAYEILLLPNIIAFISVFLNVALNILFVFGYGFIPAMGSSGLAVATLTVRTVCGLIIFLYCLRFINFKIKFDLKYVKQLLKVGYPISIAMMLEFLGFNIVTVIMGRISSLFAAAQSILITITSLTFMIPLAISNAIAIKVGYSNGARDFQDIKKYSFAGSMCALIFMTVCAIIFFLFPKEILSLLTCDRELINICLPIILVAAIYQIFDGLQVAFSGILKGLKQTLFVTIAMLCGYWLVGIPLGAVLAFKFHFELLGFWIGLATTIFTMCIVMGIFIAILFKKLKKEYSNG